jgi:uncharacterized protein YigA (DUF484 family)
MCRQLFLGGFYEWGEYCVPTTDQQLGMGWTLSLRKLRTQLLWPSERSMQIAMDRLERLEQENRQLSEHAKRDEESIDRLHYDLDDGLGRTLQDLSHTVPM